jgi:hypothetical protein
LCDALRSLGARDAAPQELTRVRRAHAARTLFAVERRRIGGDVFAPESLFESLAQRARISQQIR